MISNFAGKTAVITGAGSGFGLELSRLCAKAGMNVVLADVQADALVAADTEIKALGARTLAQRVDVSKADQMQALADATQATFGAPHLVFNNAGVGAGGLIWEHSQKDWECWPQPRLTLRIKAIS
jgi:NAD(P)-dependent dehydrogenase (short-subunit alcohol dehydrogenase family)